MLTAIAWCFFGSVFVVCVHMCCNDAIEASLYFGLRLLVKVGLFPLDTAPPESGDLIVRRQLKI